MSNAIRSRVTVNAPFGCHMVQTGCSEKVAAVSVSSLRVLPSCFPEPSRCAMRSCRVSRSWTNVLGVLATQCSRLGEPKLACVSVTACIQLDQRSKPRIRTSQPWTLR